MDTGKEGIISLKTAHPEGSFFELEIKASVWTPAKKQPMEVSRAIQFDNIVQNRVRATDKPIKEILAGKKCGVYLLLVEGGATKYAGLGNILFLTEFSSKVWVQLQAGNRVSGRPR